MKTTQRRAPTGASFHYGPHSGIHSEVQSLRLRIEELPDMARGVTHPPTQNHIEFEVSLGGGAAALAWNQWILVPATPTVKKHWRSLGHTGPNGFNGTNDWYTYTLRLPWSTLASLVGVDRDGTATQLLGHNGAHSVQIVSTTCARHDAQGNQQAYVNDKTLLWYSYPQTGAPILNSIGLPIKYATTVQNLTVEDVSTNPGGILANQDYFMFDPDSDNLALKNPKISFKIEGLGDLHQYKWEVKVRSTSSESRNWTTFCRGQVSNLQNVTVTLNAPTAPDTQEGQLVYKGTYTFDIQVEEFDNLYSAIPQKLDEWVLKSPYLTIPPTIPNSETGADDGSPGDLLYMEWDDQENLHAKASYQLNDTLGKNASKVHVDFLDQDWSLKSARDNFSTVVNVPHLNNELYVFQGGETSGNFKAIFTAEDDHAALYRDHRNKRMVAVNDYRPNLGVEWITGYYGGASWYGCWIKAGILGYDGGKHRIDTNLMPRKSNTENADQDLWTLPDYLLKQVVSAPAPWISTTTGLPTQGLVWGAINGTYFDHQNPADNYPLIGNVGVNGLWSGAGVAYERWAFGIKNNQTTVGRMVRSGNSLYNPSTSLKTANPYGLSGVGRFFKDNGQLEPSPPTIMAGGDTSQYGEGVYDNLIHPYARSIFAWTASQKHYFLILSQQKEHGYLGGWALDEAQHFLSDNSGATSSAGAGGAGYTINALHGFIEGYTSVSVTPVPNTPQNPVGAIFTPIDASEYSYQRRCAIGWW